MKQVRLECRTFGNPVVIQVTVYLGCHDERDVRVVEIAYGSSDEVPTRNMIRIHLCDDIVKAFVCAAPRIVITVLSTGLERTAVGIPCINAPTRIVFYTDSMASFAYFLVITLIEKPHINDIFFTRIDLLHALQSTFDESERLFTRNYGSQHGDAHTFGMLHGNRVLGIASKDK